MIDANKVANFSEIYEELWHTMKRYEIDVKLELVNIRTAVDIYISGDYFWANLTMLEDKDYPNIDIRTEGNQVATMLSLEKFAKEFFLVTKMVLLATEKYYTALPDKAKDVVKEFIAKFERMLGELTELINGVKEHSGGEKSG